MAKDFSGLLSIPLPQLLKLRTNFKPSMLDRDRDRDALEQELLLVSLQGVLSDIQSAVNTKLQQPDEVIPLALRVEGQTLTVDLMVEVHDHSAQVIRHREEIRLTSVGTALIIDSLNLHRWLTDEVIDDYTFSPTCRGVIHGLDSLLVADDEDDSRVFFSLSVNHTTSAVSCTVCPSHGMPQRMLYRRVA